MALLASGLIEVLQARCSDSQSCIQAGCVKAPERDQGRDGFCCSFWTSSEDYVIEHQLKASIDASGASDERCPATRAMSASALLFTIANDGGRLDFGTLLNVKRVSERNQLRYFKLWGLPSVQLAG